jgi:hypothetical protein
MSLPDREAEVAVQVLCKACRARNEGQVARSFRRIGYEARCLHEWENFL